MLYTAGVPLFLKQNLPYRRAIWHGFVVTGMNGAAPLEAAVLQSTARLLGLKPGDRVRLGTEFGRSPNGPLTVRVVGVVVSKLNAQRVARSTGDNPQNGNFAVKGPEALDFLRRNGVQARLAHSGGPARGADEVGEVAHPSTVFLRCMR